MYKRDVYAEVTHLIKAKLWDRAHERTVNNLAPEFVLKGKSLELLNILQVLNGNSADIPSWDLGGSIYLDYLVISHDLKSCLASIERSEENTVRG
jgi:hypothetical protein